MENMIEVRSVNKTFGKKGGVKTQVLSGAELTVQKGEFVSLMGASGSGKSTLLYLIGGLDREFSGDIRICGKSISKMKERELSKIRLGKIGFIFQFYNLVQNLNVEDNILLPSLVAGRSRASLKNRSISSSCIGLMKSFSLSAFLGVVVIAVTSWCWANSTARDRPTYPTPATVIFISFVIVLSI